MEARPPSPIAPPWRLATFVLASSVGVLGLRVVLSPLSGWIAGATGIPVSTYAWVWTMAGGLLIGHVWTFQQVEPRGWTYVGLGRAALTAPAVAGGFALGATAIAVPSLLLLGLGWLRVVPAPEGDSLGAGVRTLGLLVPGALWEELLVRGFAFAVLREAWGTWRALLATSAVFGLLHLQNVGATAQSVAAVTLAGVFLGMVLVRTGSLYATWAAHLAWNFVIAGVLHAAVSGIGLSAPDYRVVDTGPDWATGGVWGPEGGLFAGLGMLAAIGVLLSRRQLPAADS